MNHSAEYLTIQRIFRQCARFSELSANASARPTRRKLISRKAMVMKGDFPALIVFSEFSEEVHGS
jgi:hypothetical protein